jgi:hypothetical protein
MLGVELEGLGFTAEELAKALSPSPTSSLTDENETPELAEQAVSASDDVWLAGPHRIGCGNSTDPGAVAALLGGVAPQLMVTDPPYGVDYDPAWRHRRGVSQSGRRDKVANDTKADWAAAWALFPGNIIYVWHAALRSAVVADSLERQGFTIRAQIIWARSALSSAVMNRVGTPFARRDIGPEVGSRRPYGRSRAATKTPRRRTVRRSRSNACGGRWRTTAIRARPSMTRSLAVARR